MVGIVLVSHGTFAEGVKNGIELLVGPQKQISAIGLFHGDAPEQFKDKVSSAIDTVDSGSGVLCLGDILGGTPSNTLAQLLSEKHIRALLGTNLPMAIQAVFNRDEMALDDLADFVLQTGNEALVDLDRYLDSKATQIGQVQGEMTSNDDIASSGEARGATSGSGKGEVVLYRVDDRLIHGQVMTSWLNATGANRIMIVDNETAKDSFLRSIYRSAVPANVGVGVFNEAKAADRIMRGFNPTDRVIVLAKHPQTFSELIRRGVSIKSFVIGGMGASKGRTKLYRNISASEDERQTLRDLIGDGTSISVQILADDASVDVSKFL